MSSKEYSMRQEFLVGDSTLWSESNGNFSFGLPAGVSLEWLAIVKVNDDGAVVMNDDNQPYVALKDGVRLVLFERKENGDHAILFDWTQVSFLALALDALRLGNTAKGRLYLAAAYLGMGKPALQKILQSPSTMLHATFVGERAEGVFITVGELLTAIQALGESLVRSDALTPSPAPEEEEEEVEEVVERLPSAF